MKIETSVGQLDANCLMGAVLLGKRARDSGKGCSQHSGVVNSFLLNSAVYDHTSVFRHGASVLSSVELLPRMTGSPLSSRCQSAKAFGGQASVKVNQASWIWPDC